MDGQCITLVLVSPENGAADGYRLELPTYWGVDGVMVRSCAASAELQSGIGGLGTVEFVATSTDCLVRIHATLFYALSTGDVARVRFDSDDVSVGDSSVCP